jgi:hypothetical protein
MPNPAAVTGALTPELGARPGPTPQAAAMLPGQPSLGAAVTAGQTPTGYNMSNLPPQMRGLVYNMGRTEGSKFLGGLAAKDLERNVWSDEIRDVQGVQTPGQRNRLTNEWKPSDPSLVKLNNNLVGPQAGMEQAAKDLSEIGKSYYTKAQTAREQSRDFEQMKGLLNKGVQTGFGEQTKMDLARVGKSLGFNIDPKLPDQEMFATLAGGMAVGAQPQGQGAVSNYERELFQKAVVNLGRTTEGNQKLIDWYARIKKQDAEIGRLYERELEDNGRVTPQFLRKVREHYEKPLFSKQEMEEMQNLGGTPAAPKQVGGKNIPMPGAVEGGYRFKGGNPADPMSWELVK